MARIGRRLNATAWQALVSRQAGSGESVARFCTREGVSVASFYQWRARLRQDATAGARSAEVTTPGAFVDLGEMRVGTGRMVLRLDLGDGLVVQLTRG